MLAAGASRIFLTRGVSICVCVFVWKCEMGSGVSRRRVLRSKPHKTRRKRRRGEVTSACKSVYGRIEKNQREREREVDS